ncbi:MAG: hypothetical protein ACJ76I_13860 [Gaiellaceae bacterium]
MALIGVWVVGWLARLASIRAGDVASLASPGQVGGSSVFQTIGSLAFLATIVAMAVAARSPTDRWKIATVVFGTGEIVFAVISGRKTFIAAIAVAWLLTRPPASRPIRWGVGVAVLGGFLLVALPVIQIDRTFQNAHKTAGDSHAFLHGLRDTPGGVIDHVGDIVTLKYPFRVLMRRTMTVEAVAAAVRYAPHFGFQYGREWAIAAPTAFTPSAVWKGKPPLRLAEQFTYDYANAPRPSSTVPPSVTGDLYVNFALPGVIVGWMLIGVLLRGLVALTGSGGVGATVVLATLFVYFLIGIEATVSQIEVAVIQQGCMAAAVLLLLRLASMPRIVGAPRTEGAK